MSVSVKYYVANNRGTYIDWVQRIYGYGPLDPGEVQVVGGAGDETVYLQAGTSADVTELAGGNDRIYLTGSLADYTQQIDQSTGVYTLTRTAGLPPGRVEVVKFAVSTDDDVLYFADGHIVLNGSSNAQLFDGANLLPITASALQPGGTPVGPVDTQPVQASASPDLVLLQSGGGVVLPAQQQPGQSMRVLGSAGADEVYVTAGTSADAAELGAGIDRIYLTGKLSDYTQSIDQSSGIYTLTRVNGLPAGQSEVVRLTVGSEDDVVYFADGHIVINGATNTALYDPVSGVFAPLSYPSIEPGGTPGLNPVVTGADDPATPSTVLQGGTLDVTVNFDRPVVLAAGKTVTITALVDRADGSTQEVMLTATGDATTSLAGGVASLHFVAQMPVGLQDADGIGLKANSLTLGTAAAGEFTGVNAEAVLTTFDAIALPHQLVDTTAPNLTISADKAGSVANGPVTYTFTFSENVIGFDANDITVTHGTKGSFTVLDAKTYTLVVIPPAGAEGADLGVNVGVGLTDIAGNPVAGSTQAPAQAFDTKAPSLVVLDNVSGTANGPVVFTFDFSEAVTGFTASDIVVTGGTMGTLTQVNASQYTLVVTPSANSTTPIGVTVAAGSVNDLAGNALAAAVTVSQAVDTTTPPPADTTAPTLLITDDVPGTANGPVVFTFDFSEAVTGFTVGDIVVTGGTAGTLTQVNASQYTLVVTPNANSTTPIGVTVAAGSVSDLAGNALAAAVSVTQPVDTTTPPAADTTPPALVITDDVAGTANGPVVFTFNFDEAVTGFTIGDIAVTGGTAGTLTQVNASQYTLVVTPSANSTTPIGVTVAAGSVSDLSGNALAAAVTVSQAVDTTTPPPADTTAPTLVITDDVPGTANGPVVFTFDFSEAVTGFTASDIVVTGGTAGTLTQVNASQYTLVVTPSANSTTPIGVTVAAGSVNDLAGNALAAAVTVSQPVNTTTPPPADTTAPTLVITDNVPGTANGPVVFTFTFDEAVSGFDVSKVVLSHGTAGAFSKVNDSTYTLVVTPEANSTTPIGVTVAAGSVSDLAGNALAAAVSVSQPVNTMTPPPADTTAPTLVITDDVPGTANGPVVFTFNFDEAVTGFTVGDIAVTGGTAGVLTQVNASQYTLVVTPNANSTTPIGVTVAAGSVSDLAGNALAAAVSVTQPVNTTTPPPADTTAPTLVITDDVPGTANGPVVFTFTFDEAVSGFDVSKVVLSHGTAGAFSKVNDSTYTLVVTPEANSTAPIGVTVAAGSVSDLAGNALATAVSVTQPVNTTTTPPADTTAPTLVITDDVPGTANGPVVFTFNFDEAVTGFTVGDITVTGGTAGVLTQVNASQYTLVVTPNANSTTPIGVTVAAGSVSDVAGNALAVAVSVTQPVNTTTPPPADTTPPTLVITDDVPGTANGPVVFTFNFDEAVTGFTVGDITVTGGTAGTLTQVNASQYTLVVTPNANSTTPIGVTVAAGSVSDLSGNALAAAVSVTQPVNTTTPPPADTTAPTLVITDNVPGTANGPVVFTFTFDEAVSGFDVSKVVLSHGTAGAFSKVNDSTYTLVVTPEANSTNAITVTVGAGGASDLAGNALAAAVTVSQPVNTTTPPPADTTAPTLVITDDVPGTANGPVVFTFNFDEAVTGFTAADITVTGGTAGVLTQVNASQYTLVVTPEANSTTPIGVTVAAGSVSDLSGNALAAAVSVTQPVNTTTPPPADTTAPTLVITDDVPGTANGPVMFTFTFDEAVSGFDVSKVVLSHGTAGAFSKVNDNTYTLVVTPEANSTNAITVTVGAGGASDLAGNALAAAVTSSQAVDTTTPAPVDTTAPTLVITDDTSGTASGAVVYTFTFSEDVTGFDASDVTVAHGTKGALTMVNAHTYTLVVTPPAGAEGADLGVSVGTGVTDLAGNAMAAVTTASAQPYDTKLPTLVITDDVTGTANGPVVFTFNFDEAVTGFTVGDIAVTGGTAGVLTQVNASQYTLVVTPNANSTTPIGVTVAAGSVSDVAGNALAAAVSVSQPVNTMTPPPADTTAPTLVITDDVPGTANGPVVFTFNFDEAVTGFTVGDITVTGGTAGVLTQVNASQYTLVVTPNANSTTPIGVTVAAGSVSDLAGNALAAAVSVTQPVNTTTPPAADTTAPTLVITDNVPGTANGPVMFTFTFDEAVSGFDVSKVVLSHGTAGAFSKVNDSTYTLVVTPEANSTAPIGVTVAAGSVSDLSGNALAAAVTVSQAVDTTTPPPADTTAPTLVITDDVPGTANGPVVFTFDFSEAVTGFTAGDIVVTGGTAGTLTQVNASQYTLVVTPSANSTTPIGVTVAAGSVSDLAGNALATAVSVTQPVDTTTPPPADTTAPTLVITDNVPGTANGPVVFTFTFDEAVSGFDVSKVVLSHGTAGAFSKVNDSTYTLVVTPEANSTNAITVTVGAGGASDLAGNALAAAVTVSQPVNTTTPPPADTTAPTLVITDDVPGTANGPVVFTFNFDEAVTGFTVGDITVTGGTAGVLTQVNASQYTLVVTPSANSTTPIGVTVAAGSVSDLAGNALAAAVSVTQPVNTTTPPPADTTAPTLVITDDVPGTANGPVVFTFDFSEAVTGFTASDIAVTGGTAGTLTQVNASQYTLVVTPNANSTTPIGVTVTAGSVSDLAGNALAAAVTVSQPVNTTTPPPADTTAPTLVITDNVPGTANGPVVFTFTFDEAVSGFDVSKVVLSHGTAGAFSKVNDSTYTLVVTPEANSTAPIGVTVAAGSTSDLAGNALATAVSVTQPVDTTTPPPADTTAPTLVITDDVPGTANGPVVFTFNFDESVTGFTVGDITVTGGTVGVLTQVNASQYTLVVTPSANSTTPIGVTVAAGSVSDLAGNALAAAVSVTQPVNTTTPPPADTTAPTLVITDDVPGTANGPVVFTFTFDEAVSGFDVSKVVLSHGTAGAFSKVNDSTYTLVVTPEANSTNAITVTVGAGGASDLAGNALAAAVTASQAVDTTTPPPADTTPPTLVITDNVASGAAHAMVTYTFTFSEDVTGFDSSDVTVSHGTKGAFTMVDAHTYTLEVTPPAGAEGPDIGVSVGTGLTDVAGNAIAAVTVAPAQPYDTKAPQLTITDDVAGTANGPVVFTFDFSEAVTGFTVSDIVVTGGTAGVLTQVNASQYTLVVTPSANSTTPIGVTVAAGSVSDLSGNALAAAVTASQAVDTTTPPPADTTAPTLVITDDVPGTANGPVVFTFDFSEAVTGFTASDIVVTGGTAGTLTQVNASQYTLVVTPNANSTTPIGVTVAAGSVSDLAGNALAAAVSVTQPVNTTTPPPADTTAPTLVITDDVPGTANGPVVFTFDFSEAVTGFTASDIAVTGGTAGTLTQVNASQYTLVVTPNANSTTPIGVTVAAGSVSDLAGNALAAAVSVTQPVNTTTPPPADTTAPTLVITDDVPGTANGPVVFTFNFDEAVTGFTVGDITVTGGTAGTLTQVNASQYTLVVTPSANSTTPIGVTVAAGSVSDLSGNALAAAVTVSQAVDTTTPPPADTTAPTLVITDDVAGTANGPVVFTFNFDEAVTGFTASDIVVTGGTAGTLTQVNASQYTLVVTPSANSTTPIGVTVAAGSVSDLAGNALAAAVSVTQPVNTTTPPAADTTAPTLVITDNVPGTANGPVVFTFTFDEAVSGFDVSKVVLSHGTAGAFSKVNDSTYTLVVTPEANSTNAITVTVGAGGASDLAGNALAAAVTSSQAVDTTTPPPADTTAPTLVITDNVPGTANGPVVFTFTFDEAVSGFDVSKVVLSHGTAGAFSKVNDSTYTLVVTPEANSTAPIGVTVAAGSTSDLAGNALATAVSVTQPVNTTTTPPADTTAPTLVITDDVPGTATGPVVFTFNFDEAVTGFTAGDITVTGGTAGTLTQVNASQYTLVVTPNVNSTTPIGVTVAAGSVSDLAGNALATAVSVTQPVNTTTTPPADTTAPTLVITDNVPGTATGPVMFTFTFDEAVSGFDVSKVVLGHGTAGAFSKVNDSTYTLW